MEIEFNIIIFLHLFAVKYVALCVFESLPLLKQVTTRSAHSCLFVRDCLTSHHCINWVLHFRNGRCDLFLKFLYKHLRPFISKKADVKIVKKVKRLCGILPTGAVCVCVRERPRGRIPV